MNPLSTLARPQCSTRDFLVALFAAIDDPSQAPALRPLPPVARGAPVPRDEQRPDESPIG